MHQFFTNALVKFSIIILLHILDLFSRVRVRVRVMVSVRARVRVRVRLELGPIPTAVPLSFKEIRC